MNFDQAGVDFEKCLKPLYHSPALERKRVNVLTENRQDH